jgi:cytochrome c553/cytochrome c5
MKKLFFVFLVLGSCAPSNKNHKPIPAQPESASQNENSRNVDFQALKPIFEKNCAACHPTRHAPNWLDYSAAHVYVENGKLKRVVVDEKSMPPPGSPQSNLITESERQLIGQWADAGGPETTNNSYVSGASSTVNTPIDTTPEFAKSCVGCHDSESSKSNFSIGIPRIAGQSSRFINHQLNFFRNMRRIDPSHQMNEQALLLSDLQIADLANYFSGVKPAYENKAADPNVTSEIITSDDLERKIALGEKIVNISCVGCHIGKDGSIFPESDIIPILAFQSKAYLMRQLLLYKYKQREHGVMQMLTEDMTFNEIEAVATYFSDYKN